MEALAYRETILEQEEHLELVRRAQQGDISAFELLYRNHVGMVYALCLRMTCNTGRAEELTQDVFVRLWDRIGSFRGDSAFSSWLHRVAVNTVLVDLRSNRRRNQRVQVGEERGDESPAAVTTPDLAMDLESAIASLPPQARAVLILHDIEGYKHEEIAEQMGLATGTSKAQLHRARKLLREVLDR